MFIGRWNRLLPEFKSDPVATDLNLISHPKAIQDARILLLCAFLPDTSCWWQFWASSVAVIACGFWITTPSLREGFAFGENSAYVTDSSVPQPKHCASCQGGRSFDAAFRYFFRLVDVAARCSAIRDWTIAQIPGSTTDHHELICDGVPEICK